MKHVDITNGNSLTHKVEINHNMLRALMLNRVGAEVDSADVVTIDKIQTWQRTVKLLK
jgi:hypothetical protein